MAADLPAAIQHVLLQEAEERLRGHIATGYTNPAHGPEQPKAVEGVGEFPRAELTAPVAVHPNPTWVSAVPHRHVQSVGAE